MDIPIELYQRLFLIRAAEEMIVESYLQDEMKTPMHMSMGGEAIAVGVCRALSPEDQVLGTYRSHGIYLAKTGDIQGFFGELYGRATGAVKGKGGSMHLMAPESGFLGTSAIVASNIPLALGAAHANGIQAPGRVVAVFFGEGAVDEGVFWESFNAACLMGLNILFVCEDNGLAVHSPAAQRQGYGQISRILEEFDCNVFTASTTDAMEIFTLTQRALGAMARNHRPCFLHLEYYRYLEHVGVFEDFGAGYRSKDAFYPWLEQDPVGLLRSRMVDLVGEARIRELEVSIKEEVAAAVEMAKRAPFPPRESAFEGVII